MGGGDFLPWEPDFSLDDSVPQHNSSTKNIKQNQNQPKTSHAGPTNTLALLGLWVAPRVAVSQQGVDAP